MGLSPVTIAAGAVAAGVAYYLYQKSQESPCQAGYAVYPGSGQCVPLVCPSGYTRNMTTGACSPTAQAPSQEPCPTGQARGANGQCAPVPCPAGQTRDSYGECFVPCPNAGDVREYGECHPPCSGASRWDSAARSCVTPEPIDKTPDVGLSDVPQVREDLDLGRQLREGSAGSRSVLRNAMRGGAGVSSAQGLTLVGSDMMSRSDLRRLRGR